MFTKSLNVESFWPHSIPPESTWPKSNEASETMPQQQWIFLEPRCPGKKQNTHESRYPKRTRKDMCIHNVPLDSYKLQGSEKTNTKNPDLGPPLANALDPLPEQAR